MTVWEAIALGLVQGLTEFLPISSSGHLVLAQRFFGLHKDILTFDVLLHMSTLIAILVFFGRRLFQISWKKWLLVGVGTIPAGVIGVLFKDSIEAIFAAGRWVGWELVVTGVINLVTDRVLEKQKATAALEKRDTTAFRKKVGLKESLVMGIGQAIAIIPGISRSGTTVATGIWQKIDREEAFEFSFLLAIPALLGAGVLQLKDVTAADLGAFSWTAVIAGCSAALIAGLASLIVFHWVIKKARLEWFGWYCIVLGMVAIFFTR